MPMSLYHPYSELADFLLSKLETSNDSSHDRGHLERVWALVQDIHNKEGGDLKILLAATLLHDAIAIEKNHPDRSLASTQAAKKATNLLASLNWDDLAIAKVEHAIAAHSFSANIEPQSIEAKILQDADRLDAIGAIGIARCFYISGRLSTSLYDWNDPRATNRRLDDKKYALDHFYLKLLPIAKSMKTKRGQEIATRRKAVMLDFVENFLAEAELATGQ